MKLCMDVPILYRDDHLLVLDKPPGVMVHPNAYDWKSKTCIDIVGELTGARVHTIHRLDRGTSGIVMFAIEPRSAAALSLAFRERRVSKRYLALVRGHILEAGCVDSPIKRRPDSPEAAALTLYTPLSRTEIPVPLGPHPSARYTLVSLDLKTGRAHQARRHMQRINHPVVGDKPHGDRDHNRYFHGRFGREYLFLRAIELRFPHPVLGRTIRIWAGLPDYWRTVMDAIGIEFPSDIQPESGVEVLSSELQ